VLLVNAATPVWATLTFTDETSNFTSDGRIYFNIPSDWIQTDVNGTTLYWIRISTTTTPTTGIKVYSIIPGDSVIGLLNLNSSQILNEEWAWCSFGTNIYITIRNFGNSYYEGDIFITSTSSDTNKQNFFINNHTYSLFYEKSDYISSAIDLPALRDEIVTARGSKSSLDARLDVSLNDDGTLKEELWGHSALTDMPDISGANSDHDARYLRKNADDSNGSNRLTLGAVTIDTDTLYVDPVNHRVGIGTTEPSCKLDIYGTTKIHSGYLAVYNATPDFYLIDTDTSDQVVFTLRDNIASVRDGSYGKIQDWDVNTKNSFFYGNVGIGTDSPDTLLDIEGDDATLTIQNTGTTGTRSRLRLNQQGAIDRDRHIIGSYQGTDLTTLVLGGNSTNDGTFAVYTGAANILGLFQDENGNVGIGTTSPDSSSKLHIIGRLRIDDTTNATSRTLQTYLPIIVNGTTYYLALYQ